MNCEELNFTLGYNVITNSMYFGLQHQCIISVICFNCVMYVTPLELNQKFYIKKNILAELIVYMETQLSEHFAVV